MLQWSISALNSAYRPVPTIIEAAEALYAGHDVREITHSHAGRKNLAETSDKLVEIIRRAQQRREKIVCFVTGIPGAGKTLAGLNVVHNPALRRDGRPPAVFLSGNGPLVKIVSAAIVRDFRRRNQLGGAERTVSTFVQNVHTFVRAALDKPEGELVELMRNTDGSLNRRIDAILNDDTKYCPKCESLLVVRTATKGFNRGEQFWGCSNFPRCRYILRNA
jgi:hypothetical protein